MNSATDFAGDELGATIKRGNVHTLTAGASANVAARATRRRRSMMIAVFNRHSPDEQSLRRSVDLVNSSSFPALRKDGLGMRSYHLLPQNPVLNASTLSPFHSRRPVTLSLTRARLPMPLSPLSPFHLVTELPGSKSHARRQCLCLIRLINGTVKPSHPRRRRSVLVQVTA